MGTKGIFSHCVDERWSPPARGHCSCTVHVYDLLDTQMPMADSSASVPISELMMTGVLTTIAITDGNNFVEGLMENERRGPFHWRVLHRGQLERFLTRASRADLHESLCLQPSVLAALSLDRDELVVGAPTMCALGVQAAVVNALLNPRVRRPVFERWTA